MDKRLRLPLGDWLRHRLAHMRHIEPGTRAQYRRCIDRWIDPPDRAGWVLGRIALGDLVPQHGAKFIAFAFDELELGGAAVRKGFDLIRRGLDDAVEEGILPDNPLPPKAIPVKQKMQTVPTPAQLARILELPEDFDGTNRSRLLLMLASRTGARVGELCGLIWSAIDFERETLTVSQAIDVVAGQPRVKRPKTKAGLRTLKLDKLLLAELHVARLHAMRARQKGQHIDALPVLHDGADDGGFWRPDAAAQQAKRLLTRLGLGCSIHMLRHAHATMLLNARHSPEVVRQRLGHSDISVTLRVYGHAIPADDAQLALTVDALLARRAGKREEQEQREAG